MRFLHWERSPHSNIHRSRSKRGHLFGIYSLASWYYNAERRNFMASRIRQFAKRQSLKLKYLKNPPNRGDQIKLVKINELRLVHNLLLAELIQLERKLKKRSQSIVNAMHRYRKGVEELQKLEELIARKRESLNFAKRNIKLSLTKEGCAEKGNEKMPDECKPFVKAEKERSLGGDDKRSKFRGVNSNALVLKYFRKWLTKANIVRRASNVRDSYYGVMPEIKQRVSLETGNLPATFLIDSVTNMGNNIEYDDETPIEVTTSSSSQIYMSYLNLRRASAKSGKKEINKSRQSRRFSKFSRFSRFSGKIHSGKRHSSKIRQNRISGVAGQRRSQQGVKRKKRRKSHKSLESTTSDMADRRTSRKGSRKRKIRRKSNKSIRRTLSDFDITHQRIGAKRKRGRKRVESNEKGLLQDQSPKSEANLDENAISHRVSRKYGKRNRRKSKRKSVEGRRLSALRRKDKRKSSASNNDDKSKDGSLKVDTTSNRKMSVDFSGVQRMKGSATKSTGSSSKSFGSVSQFSLLEEYWGVSLRRSHDNTLDRMEALSSVLDDLLQVETPKIATTQATTEKTIAHQQTREINDLHKLFILLKECEECQRQQGIEQSFKNKNQGSDFLAMAAGLPDCLPDDFHMNREMICSCNM